MKLQTVLLRAVISRGIPIQQPQSEHDQVDSDDRRQNQVATGSPVPREERNRAEEGSYRDDLAAPHPRSAQLVLFCNAWVHDDQQWRFRLPLKIKYFAAQGRMFLDLYLAEASRVFQAIEHQKGAIRHSAEGDTVARKWGGGLEILEEHRALSGRDQRHPIPFLPGLVVDLELSKRTRLVGNHGDTLITRLVESASFRMSKAGQALRVCQSRAARVSTFGPMASLLGKRRLPCLAHSGPVVARSGRIHWRMGCIPRPATYPVNENAEERSRKTLLPTRPKLHAGNKSSPAGRAAKT